MSYHERIRQLEYLHREIDNKIDGMEKNHPHVDQIKVQDMKKKRLQYMDELSRLRKLQWDLDHDRVDLDDY